MAALIQAPNFKHRPPVNMYPHLTFEPYAHKQFPEWVTAPAGWAPISGMETEAVGGAVKVLVHDEEEKQAVLSGSASTVRETDEKTSLYAQAETLGIDVDKRWSLDTLRRKVTGRSEAA